MLALTSHMSLLIPVTNCHTFLDPRSLGRDILYGVTVHGYGNRFTDSSKATESAVRRTCQARDNIMF